MIVSQKHKYIFISVPKTGSQTIRDFLLKYDTTAQWNKFYDQDKEIFIREHATALEIKNKIGSFYQDYQIIAFIREPLSKTVSAYFFYKGQQVSDVLKRKTNTRWMTLSNVLLAKILPYKLYALVKPVLRNYEYLCDNSGKVIVQHVGRTEFLKDDLGKIFSKLNLPFEIEKLESRNLSKYDRKKDHIGSGFFRKMLTRKYAKDVSFYNGLSKN